MKSFIITLFFMASTISYSLYAQEATNYYTKDTMQIGGDSFEVRKREFNIYLDYLPNFEQKKKRMTFLVPHRYKLEDEGVFIDAIKYAFTEEGLSDLIETMIKEHKTGIMLYGFKLFFDSEWRIVMLDVEFVNTKTMLNIRPEKIEKMISYLKGHAKYLPRKEIYAKMPPDLYIYSDAIWVTIDEKVNGRLVTVF